MSANEKPKQLLEKYGKTIALFIAEEMVKEYETNICGRGYDFDDAMWEAQKVEWEEVVKEIIEDMEF